MPPQESLHPTGWVADHAHPLPCLHEFHVPEYSVRAHELRCIVGVPMAYARTRRFWSSRFPAGTSPQGMEYRQTADPPFRPQWSEIRRMVYRNPSFGLRGTSMQLSLLTGRACTSDPFMTWNFPATESR